MKNTKLRNHKPPSPAMIAHRARLIRKDWDGDEHYKRAGIPNAPYVVPTMKTSGLHDEWWSVA